MIEKLILIGREEELTNYRSTQEWFNSYKAITKDLSPIEAAVTGGFICQQFSFSFLSGYQAAIRRMFPDSSADRLSALCVSEINGGHPKAIQTTLINNKVSGVKTYVTAGSDVQDLFVLCKTSKTREGRPLLKMAHIGSDQQNVIIENFDIPFLKEIKHGKVHLQNVEVQSGQILEGDGFSDYTRPFRSVEDIHVSAAYHAMLLRQAINYNWDKDLREQLSLHITTLRSLDQLAPDDNETILLIAAQEKRFTELLSTIESNIQSHSPKSFQEDWTINKKVLKLSAKLKQQRLEKARAALYNE